jgi:subtilase family serine protease
MEPFLQIAQFSGPSAEPSASAPRQAFSGTQLAVLYGVPAIRPALGKRRASIAIVVAHSYQNMQVDLLLYWQSAANFCATVACPVLTVHTMPGPASFNEQWAQEACLDVQMACTMNPYARVLVVEASSASLGDMLAAVDYAADHADVVSMSWGANDVAAFAPYASRFSREHVTFCAASGDTNVASWPSVVDTCVSVGGTTLLWAPCALTRLRLPTPYSRSEFTWPSAGCGYSASVARPAYQSAVNATAARLIPDLSLVANPRSGVYVVYNGSWLVFGGTSLATPLFAGMISLANQMRLNVGKHPLSTQNGALHSILYAIYADPRKYAAAFKDITLGTNAGSSLLGGLAEYAEGQGFQVPTGLGSPNCARLCADLVAAP